MWLGQKQSPGTPETVIEQTAAKYQEAYDRLTG